MKKNNINNKLLSEVDRLRKRLAQLETFETERSKAKDALWNNQEKLYQAQKMEALGTLVAGVAHEINNPINLIMFNIPLFQKVWKDLLPVLKQDAIENPNKKYGGLTYEFLNENLGQLLSDMDMAANRVAKIVTDLKNFSRQTNVTEIRQIQINTAVENAMRLAQTTLKKSHVRLDLELARGLPLMEGNLQSVEQIILNMTINAIQAIEHDHGQIKITTGLRKKDGQLFIMISDNGRGISSAIADRIFDPFVTDKQTDGGTGLGLSVTYSLVRAHDGKIEFHSQKKKGTTFKVLFPISLKRKSAKILVVDDEAAVREMLVGALTMDRPYLVDEASNGIEACIRLGTYHPDLLILDIFMPEMDGLEVCRNIKKEPELADMKVVITTGLPHDVKLKAVKELGFTNIRIKPFNIQEFLQTVDTLLTA